MFQRRNGKSEMAMLMAKTMAENGRRVTVITFDQARTVADLQRAMPGCLCEIVGDMGVMPHPKVRKS